MSLEKHAWGFDPESQAASPDDLHEICLDDDNKEAQTPLPAGSRPECLKNAVHECVFVALVAFAAATPVFLQRSVVVVAGPISGALQMTPAQIAWATASSGLTTGAFLLPFGYIADTCPILPRKTLLILSLVVFCLLVSCTSFSRTGVVLDIISGLTGIACAANVPIAVGILSLVYPTPSRRKNVVFSSFLMGTPAATIIGGLGSGALALEISWKAPFIALAALYAAVSGLACVFVPNVSEPEPEKETEVRIIAEPEAFPILSIEAPKEKSKLLQFDWLGLFLLVTGLLLFTIALSIGPQGPEPWKTPTVILLLTLGVLSLGCFLLWENITKTPMIPPSIWENLTVTLVIICTLAAAMSFYSQLFWVSLFMQDLGGLKPFEVAVRLVPQALVGLVLSPLVGLIMHRVPGTVLLAVAATSLVISNVLLIFLRQGSNYLTWIFPSVVLSTVGMDWIMNVGSLYILSSLPLKHHSVGASLLQTTSRLGVPLGMGVTTAIWSSYDREWQDTYPELAYTNTFMATTAFAGISLVLVPFIRIGRQGHSEHEPLENNNSNDEPKPSISVPPQPPTPPRNPRNESGNRPSKRWSPVDTLAASVTSERQHTAAPSVSSQSSRKSEDTSNTNKTTRTTIRHGCSPSERVVWVVCEECGTTKRHNQPRTTVGDPARYFNDPAFGSTTKDINQTNPYGTNSSNSGQNHHHHHPPQLQLPRPYGGRRRQPLMNRQILTHQMLTQGFQP
ncbi:MFS general substrate transporter [Daldinia decipiens]|uniref:MFS general substrate transporter n=1 Tax=Daldinia decipiens TaxID=326647 RepID=UPI0020C20026|nr:MFS general substrate transporter [Daldinia decipiens]KAI1657352.1 MFS general substrate transporter [Daldinia decipiens]